MICNTQSLSCSSANQIANKSVFNLSKAIVETVFTRVVKIDGLENYGK